MHFLVVLCLFTTIVALPAPDIIPDAIPNDSDNSILPEPVVKGDEEKPFEQVPEKDLEDPKEVKDPEGFENTDKVSENIENSVKDPEGFENTDKVPENIENSVKDPEGIENSSPVNQFHEDKEFEFNKDEKNEQEEKEQNPPASVSVEYDKLSLQSILSAFSQMFDKIVAFLNPKGNFLVE